MHCTQWFSIKNKLACNFFQISQTKVSEVVRLVLVIYVTMVTGCPVDLMKFVAAKSVEIPEGKVMIG